MSFWLRILVSHYTSRSAIMHCVLILAFPLSHEALTTFAVWFLRRCVEQPAYIAHIQQEGSLLPSDVPTGTNPLETLKEIMQNMCSCLAAKKTPILAPDYIQLLQLLVALCTEIPGLVDLAWEVYHSTAYQCQMPDNPTLTHLHHAHLDFIQSVGWASGQFYKTSVGVKAMVQLMTHNYYSMQEVRPCW